MKPEYRPEIDGLRAVAVIPVILFHAGVAGFDGGFIGVDIFFVISGFLITTIIAAEIDRDRFTLLNFYERRVRRIFPALLLVLLAVMLLSVFLFLPSQFRDIPQTILGTIFFVSNIVFYTMSGYFTAAAETKPLLHTWSLGVEEQFYIFFPILLIIIARYAPQWRNRLVVLFTVLSLLLSILITPVRPDAAFYMIPTRAWELFAGSILALHMVPVSQNNAVRESLSAVGLAMILVAIFTYTKATIFPGYAALLPVVGTAMIIHSARDTLVGRLLSVRLLVFLGLISYSLYLWHWPVIVFAEAAQLHLHSTLIVGLSILLAFLSWKFVENPFRSRQKMPPRRLFRFFILSSVAVIGLAVTMGALNGFPERFSSQVVAYDSGNDDSSPLRTDCHSLAAQFATPCTMGADVPATAVLWADSHGVELSYALGEIAREKGWSIEQVTASACPPALDISIAIRSGCEKFNNDVLAYLKTNSAIETVILTAFYSNPVYPSDSLLQGLQKTVSALEAAGKKVVLVAPHPVYDFSVPESLARSALRTGDFEEKSMPQDPFLKREKPVLDLFSAMEADGRNIIWPASQMCHDGQCYLAKEGRSLYFDKNHLSMFGAHLVAPAIAAHISLPDPE